MYGSNFASKHATGLRPSRVAFEGAVAGLGLVVLVDWKADCGCGAVGCGCGWNGFWEFGCGCNGFWPNADVWAGPNADTGA